MAESKFLKAYCSKTGRYYGLEIKKFGSKWKVVNMISVSRAYETNQKIVQTYDSTLEIAAKQIGKVNQFG